MEAEREAIRDIEICIDTKQRELKCEQLIEKAKEENKSFLRAKATTMLLGEYFEQKRYRDALALADTLIPFLKRIEHKQLIIEASLIHAKVFHAVQDLPKAKGALILSQAAASDIYVKPELQSKLDHTGGILCCDGNDYQVAFSYFFESFFNLIKIDTDRAQEELMNLLICKVMASQHSEIPLLLGRKELAPFVGPATETILDISECVQKHQLHDFRSLLETRKQYLSGDVVQQALGRLQVIIVERYITRVLSAYCRIEMSFLAELTGLELEFIHQTVRTMILDGKLLGSIEEDSGHVTLQHKEVRTDLHVAATEVLSKMKVAVGQLDSKVADWRT
ncbi:PCI domain [Carpediemonas membranifera]|uniref:PCI domain n=1 Tax=Carpediemonas membranifera TaxID=201153 RepID=A0A8J6AXW1_9EUKA|nr:PCI domain [Carpediemonas membranifera]|eukprot:KAG9396823.1 PCI domain [Carpediemonas membranifera]